MSQKIKLKNEHIYEHAAAYLVMMAGAITLKKGFLKKAKEDKPIGKPLEDALEADKQSVELAKVLYQCFLLLKKDYTSGAINTARYMSHLQKYHEFFQLVDLKKVDVPEELNSKAILEEINKYIA